MKSRLRPDAAAWRQSLMTGPASVLLDIARNYLGDIRIPFDKPGIIARLEAFITKPETRAAILSLLDRKDIVILGTLALAGPLTMAELGVILAGEIPASELDLALVNLEDRLLIFHYRERELIVRALNPLLHALLESRVSIEAGFLAMDASPEVAVSSPRLRMASRPVSGSTQGNFERPAPSLAKPEPPQADWQSLVCAESSPRAASYHPDAVANLAPSPTPVAEIRGKGASISVAPVPGAFENALPPSPDLPSHASHQDSLPGQTVEALAAPPIASSVCAREFLAGLAVFLFASLFHQPAWRKKDGDLTARALAKAAGIMPGIDTARASLVTRAMAGAGFLSDGDDRPGNSGLKAFVSVLEAGPFALSFSLACALASGEDRRIAAETIDAVAQALATAASRDGPPGGSLCRPTGLRRWFRIALAKTGLLAGPSPDCEAIIRWLEALSLLQEVEPGLLEYWLGAGSPAGRRTEAGFAEASDVDREGGGASEPEPGRSGEDIGGRDGAVAQREPSILDHSASSGARILVAEGTQTLHLFPEASLWDRLLVGLIARARHLGRIWTFDLDKDCFRRALDLGLEASSILKRLSALAGTALPQSLIFLLESWGRDYRAVQVYSGTVLVAEDRLRPILEHALVLDPFIAQTIAPGVYLLKDVERQRVQKALSLAGIAMPATREAPGFDFGAMILNASPANTASEAVPEYVSVVEPSSVSRSDAAFVSADPSWPRFTDPEAVVAALEEHAVGLGAAGSEPVRQQQLDRIRRKLVVSLSQLEHCEYKPQHLSAGALDYQGKLRLVERALKNPTDRLEIVVPPQNPDDPAQRLFLRAVRLDKSGSGATLEAENIATGSPCLVTIAAALSIRRIPASPFGDQS